MKKTGLFIVIVVIVAAITGVLIYNSKKNSSAGNNNTVTNNNDTTSTQANPKGEASIGSSPFLGSKNSAKLAIVEFSDYECPYCQRFETETFDSVINQFVNTGQAIFVYRNFPLPFHEPAATKDANAALCVRSLSDDKNYFNFGRLLYQNSGLNGQGLSDDKMLSLVKQVGVDTDKFKTCSAAQSFAGAVKTDTADGTAAGVDGTPAFLIGKFDPATGNVNGELLVGAQPLSAFQEVVARYQ